MKLHSRFRRPVAIVFTVLGFGALLFGAARAAGLWINATPSMPEGIYRVTSVEPGPIARGSMVAICPSTGVLAVAIPRRYLGPGSCPGQVEPLLKHVAAVSGDQVEVSEYAIRVNGHALPNSRRFARDCAGRPLPHIPDGRYRIAKDSVWLFAPVARSWDSRYFGPQPAADIIGIAKPVLIVGIGKAVCGS